MTDSDKSYYDKVNSLTDEEWEEKCHFYDDCSICKMALHKELFTVTKHMCIRDMKIERFKQELEANDIYY